MSRYAEHAIFSDTDQKELETTIYECYPLHPVSTFILPRLSERVAQNERTLFTFLSADGTSTLPAFLRGLKDKDFRVITPDLIFDYFDPVLQKEPFAGELHKNYVLTKTILGQIEDQILESKIVKTISLIYLLGQFDKLKPIKEEIVGIYSMEYKPAEIEAAIEHLIKDEYVIYLKRSNDYLKLKQTSGVDVEQKISDTIAALTPSFSLKSALNAKKKGTASFDQLYNVLTAPEYHIGIRSGVIPIYIAAVFHEFSEDIILQNDLGQLPLSADTLQMINACPEDYTLVFLEWNPEKQEFVSKLSEIFSNYVIEAEKNLSAYDFVASAMKRWYLSLPRYAKESKGIGDKESSKRYLKMVKLLKLNLNGHELLFEKLPEAFGYRDFNEGLAENIENAKNYYEVK